MSYNYKHKQFLQHFMYARMVSETDAKQLNQTLFSNENVEHTIELINNKITPLEFSINRVVCEQNGDINYVFIATFVNNFNVKLDPNKVLFAKLVDYIIMQGGSVSYDEVISFNSEISVTLLESFFTHKYLITDKNRKIFLSPLTISELEQYLVEKMANNKCSGCLNIIVYGVRCKSCKQFAHGYCLNTYFNNVGSKKCPKCSNQMSYEWNPIRIFDKL